MVYAFVFLLLAAYLAALAVGLGGWAWLLLWPAASFALLGVAYLGGSPRLLGKRADGRRAWWAWPAMGPVLALLAGVWHLQRARGEAAWHEVAPGLWLGRRPLPGDLPEGAKLVVDLTSEFVPSTRTLAGRDYVCLPTLDGLAPPAADVERLLERIAASDGAYVHCALGHGRSALVAAAVLLRRGAVADVAAAEALLRQRRPGVRLKPGQRRLLRTLFPSATGGAGG